MSAPKWTPGPWRSRAYGLRPDDGPTCFLIAESDGSEVARTLGYSREDSANAHLIAAAPELLDEGSNALTVLRRLRTEGPSAISFINLDGAIFGLEAALAKARGVVVS